MTTIRANCPNCGDIQLSSASAMECLYGDNEFFAYRFRSPEDGNIVLKMASERIFELLVSSGVVIVKFNPESPVDEIAQRETIANAHGQIRDEEISGFATELVDAYPEKIFNEIKQNLELDPVYLSL